MSTPPTPTISLDSLDISKFLEGIQDSTMSTNSGNFQQWMEEPQKTLSYTSTASSSNGLTAPSTSKVYSSGSSGGTGFPPNPNNEVQVIIQPNDFHDGNQDTVSANSGNFQQWLEEPRNIESYVSTASCSNGLTAPSPYSASTSNVYSTGSSGSTGFPPNPNNEVQVIIPPYGGYNAIVRPGCVNNAPQVPNNGRRHKRNRTAFSEHQLAALEQQYTKDRYLERDRRNDLAQALNLNPQTVKVWFQNRRMKEKKDRLENETSSNTSQVNINEDFSFVRVEGQYYPGLHAGSYSMLPPLNPVLPPPNPIGLGSILPPPNPILPSPISMLPPPNPIGLGRTQPPPNYMVPPPNPMLPPAMPPMMPSTEPQILPPAQPPTNEMPYLAGNGIPSFNLNRDSFGLDEALDYFDAL